MSIDRIAIVGTGTIGASWATHFLARGFDVVATDPGSGAEDALRRYVDGAWDTAARLGVADGASPDRLSFTTDLHEAVSASDFVQENAPERPDLKIALLADIDRAAGPDVIIASSSSGITMSVMQAECVRADRTVIGHPFNPPHVIPLVEVVGGAKTSAETISAAMDFYKVIGKKPVLLRKELPGHVANRLQSALYREVVHLIADGYSGWPTRTTRCPGARAALGCDGPEPVVAPGRRGRRDHPFHGDPDAPHDRRLAGPGQSGLHPGIGAGDRRRSPRRGAGPLDPTVVRRARRHVAGADRRARRTPVVTRTGITFNQKGKP
ncbi:3-hydroxyacyl-CoA dehydrogenase NAD-binding domain-containing protein [Mycolicibacterium fortuitum]|nr:3-hydroxyacyl-CoA dehydrogenase NAD-binding domain-containing protein [Mycolicibacterium fortuitum]